MLAAALGYSDAIIAGLLGHKLHTITNMEETRRKLHDQIAQAVMDAEGYAKELHQMQKKVASDSLAYHMSSRKLKKPPTASWKALIYTVCAKGLLLNTASTQMYTAYATENTVREAYQGAHPRK